MKKREKEKILNSLRAQLIILEEHAERLRQNISDLKQSESGEILPDIIEEKTIRILSGVNDVYESVLKKRSVI